MLKIADILAAEFEECSVDRFSKLRHVDRNWQKIYLSHDDKKKLYYVTIEQWDYTKYPDFPTDYGYQATAYFNRREETRDTFKVDMLYPKSVEQIEDFFRDVFMRMECVAVDD